MSRKVHWAGQPALRLPALFAAVLLVVSGCAESDGRGGREGTGGSSGSSTPTAQSVAGQPVAWRPVAHQSGQLKVEMFPVERLANTARTRFRVTNMGSEPFRSSLAFHIPNEAAVDTVAGVSLVDAANRKRYFPLFTTDKVCACSKVQGDAMAPQQALDLYALFPVLPKDVKRIGVSVPLTPVFSDIPIVDGAPDPVPGQDIDPARAAFGRPTVLSLISTSEGYGQAVDEDDVNQTVRLSADVVFAVNKADLTPAAKSILEDVARRIDASPGKAVKIDGHTDSTGDDAINEPLSRRRAEAVHQQLQRLVTRQGVTYQVAGHGSKQPIASNDTPAGRQRNRRVTVQFSRPAPAPPRSPAPAAPTGAVPTAPLVDGKVPVVQSVTSRTYPGIEIQINHFYRDSTGLATMLWSVHNNGTQKQRVDFGGQSYLAGYLASVTTAGVVLNDRAAKVAYLSLRDSAGGCVCTDSTAVEGLSEIQSGGGVLYYNSFLLPADLRSIDVIFGEEHGQVRDVAIR